MSDPEIKPVVSVVSNVNGGTLLSPDCVESRYPGAVLQIVPPAPRKVANPGPIGLFGFALTTFVLGLYQCGAGLPGENPHGNVGPIQAVLGLGLFCGGVAQFVAGIMEFVLGNTLGSAICCTYGGFWLAFSMFMIPSIGIQDAYKGDARAYSFALGIFLLLWCVMTIIFFVALLRTSVVMLLVFGFLIAVYFSFSMMEFTRTSNPAMSLALNKLGGVLAVVDASLAFYAGAAALFTPETTWVRLPMGEFAKAEGGNLGAA